MSNIIRKLSKSSSSRSLRSHDSFASSSDNFVYNLASSSYELNKFVKPLAASSYSHHIKFNNSIR